MRTTKLILLLPAIFSAVNPVCATPVITFLGLGTTPDCPHIYVTTAVYDSFPTNVSLSPGALVFFTVRASGSGTLSFQWLLNGQQIATGCGGIPCSYELGCTYGYPGTELPPGDYSVVITDSSGSITSRVVTLTIDPTFTKITTDPVVTVRSPHCSFGGTWGDFNNDGFADLFVFNGQDSNSENPYLFRNNGDGTFTQLTSGPPVDLASQAPSACWGDYDNDGNLDLLVATRFNNLLYHNNGAPNYDFSQITSGSILSGYANAYGGAAWVDYDQDGFLDLFETPFDPAANSHCFLYHNNGDGSFTPDTSSVLASDLGSSIGCAWGDYDNDGKIDLFVGGGRGSGAPQAANRLYHNNGDGTFTRVTNGSVGSIITDLAHSGVCAWGDYDNDGFLDLFVVNVSGEPHFLYHNNGDGTFTRTYGIVVNTPSQWFDIGNNPEGCAWGDYDNDGFLDLFVTDEGSTAVLVNFLYHNNGDGTFTKITTGSPVSEFSDSTGCSWVDYDNDGFLDLFAARGDGRSNFLYRNNGNTNNWLTVKLVGTVSNRSAIGAKVRVKAFYRGASRWQLRQITGGGGWLGHNELQANFGLGDATNVDTVRIEWPSGTVQEFHNVAPRQILTYTEPPRLLAGVTNGAPYFSVKGGRFMQYDIQASSDLAAWSPLGTLTITNINGTAAISDPGTSGADHRFYRAVSH